MVRKLRADAAAQKFADDCGRFRQVFPPRERSHLDKYVKLLETACSLYELSFDAEQKQEIQRFLVRKVNLCGKYRRNSTRCRRLSQIGIVVEETVCYALKPYGTCNC